MYFELSDQERASFVACSSFTRLDGPLQLMRFTSSDRDHAAALGAADPRCGLYRSYWMYGCDVIALLNGVHDGATTKGPYGLRLIGKISEHWAHCDDWGDLQRAWLMQIPEGESVGAYVGPAKFQPKASVQAQRRVGRFTERSYPGGSLQLVLGLRPTQRHWVRGPLPTLRLSTAKIAELGSLR